MNPNVPDTTHYLDCMKQPLICILFCHEWMHLTEISKTSQKHAVYIRKTKNHHQNSFILKYYENCLKSDTKTCKIQKSVSNIPTNTVIKDNNTFSKNC